MSGSYRVKVTAVLIAGFLLSLVAQSAVGARWPRGRSVTELGFGVTWLAVGYYLVFLRTNLFFPAP